MLSRIGIFYITLDLNHNRQIKKCTTYSEDLNYNIIFIFGWTNNDKGKWISHCNFVKTIMAMDRPIKN